ncbi:MAG TPA: hypothetical protein VNG51_29610 [Ktedonobacteraceae bacterium]|nr:hypothetical protein [Ktedonobacteraceae bacterium]
MILHLGERVFWGAPEVIYLEGAITQLDEQSQTVMVHVDKATPHSAHLIGTDMPFAADGVKPLSGDTPPGVTSERSTERLPAPKLSDEEKIQRAAAVAVHQQYGYALPPKQEEVLIAQVAQVLGSDKTMRAHVIDTMSAILEREL